MNKKISVIIVNYNGSKYIKRCVDAVYRSSKKNFEVIIVDDASSDNSLAVIKKICQPYRLFVNEKNLGSSYSRNIGAKKAIGKYLLFIDVDTEIFSDSLMMTEKYFDENKDVGAFQGCLLNRDRRTIETMGHYLSFLGYPYETGIGKEQDGELNVIDILGGRTACLGIRKKIFDTINGFDNDYIIYGEDTDLCWRVWLAGSRVVYLPTVKVLHYQKSSLSETTRERIFYEGTKNNLRNCLKNLEISRLWYVMPLFLMSTYVLVFKTIIYGDLKHTRAIANGIYWNLKNIRSTLKLRKIPRSIEKEILFGRTRSTTVFLKSLNWLKQV